MRIGKLRERRSSQIPLVSLLASSVFLLSSVRHCDQLVAIVQWRYLGFLLPQLPKHEEAILFVPRLGLNLSVTIMDRPKRGWFFNTFAIDLRAMAVFRMGLAFFACFDLVRRVNDSLYWYTSSTIEPASTTFVDDTPHRAAIHQLFFFRGSLVSSVSTCAIDMRISSSRVFLSKQGNQIFMFALTTLSALAMGLGWKTRLTTFTTWVLVTMLQGRQESFNDASDKVRGDLCFHFLLPTRHLTLIIVLGAN